MVDNHGRQRLLDGERMAQMLYRTMKKTGDELSILGFGVMRLKEKRGKIIEDIATRQIRMSIGQGVNYLDTAWPYHGGNSEPFLGRALTDGYREKVKVATKLPHWLAKSREDMDTFLNAQLERLRTDHIDYYLLHGVDGETWDTAKRIGAIEFLEQAKKDGRIINAGFSFHGDKDSFKRIVDDNDWEFCQIQYNYLDEQNQAGKEGLQYAAGKGLGVIVMEPLRGGNLTGKIPPSVQAIWDEADVKRTPAEWALRWIWNHPEVTVILSGMNDDEHIKENIRIASEAIPYSLSEKELDLVRRAGEEYRKLMRIGCTGCGYCMPCPSGVNIPFCFEVYNGLHMFGGTWKAKMDARMSYMTQLAEIPGMRTASYPSQCQQCGACEEACPQSLPIQELLEDVVEEFEGPMLGLLERIMKVVLVFQRRGALREGRRTER
jgi:predicted aldo/keto reductase-like oxidoreductase